jgi:hypothetical protein
MAVRSTFEAAGSFLEMLDIVRADVIEALEHQEYPFDLLLSDMQYVRDPGRNPLFDVGLTYHEGAYLHDTPGLKGTGIEYEDISAPVHGIMADIWFEIVRYRDELKCYILYDRAIYSSSLMADLTENYRLMLQTFATRPHLRLTDWSMRLKALERKRAVDAKYDSRARLRQILDGTKRQDKGGIA